MCCVTKKVILRRAIVLIKDMKVAIVNKYFPLEGKINCLYDILRNIQIDTSRLSEKSQHLYQEICNQEKSN